MGFFPISHLGVNAQGSLERTKTWQHFCQPEFLMDYMEESLSLPKWPRSEGEINAYCLYK